MQFSWIFLLFAMFSSEPPRFTEPTELKVEIVGIEKPQGALLVAVYDSADSFPKDGKAMKEIRVPVSADRVSFKVEDLPPGTYAVALCHDVNDDGEFNTNFIGMPLEPYGFSNDAKPGLSAPSFSSSSFELRKSTSIRITLQH